MVTFALIQEHLYLPQIPSALNRLTLQARSISLTGMIALFLSTAAAVIKSR